MPWPIPGFYDPARAEDWGYTPDAAALFLAAHAYREAHGITAASEDRRRVHLVLVDLQKDFCLPAGALYVGGRGGRGAVEDNDRIARFIYGNLGRIAEITCTMDTHLPFQIFFASFWVDASGAPLAPYREVTAAQVRSREALPNPALAAWLAGGDEDALRRQAEFYCAELERAGKYRLYLWPPHCLLGGEGHPLAGIIQEARLFHAYARRALNPIESKGMSPLTENYSVLRPEVLTRPDGTTLAEANTALIQRLLRDDVVLVAGQAASHCVKSTVDDLLAEVRRVDPARAGRVVVLRDCTSAVAVPDPARAGAFLADYTDEAEAAFTRYERAGARVVRSTDAWEDWLPPG